MKLNDYLKENNAQMSSRLIDILVETIKIVDVDFYEGLIYENRSPEQIANHVANVDWDEEDFIKILKTASRLAKIWNFS